MSADKYPSIFSRQMAAIVYCLLLARRHSQRPEVICPLSYLLFLSNQLRFPVFPCICWLNEDDKKSICIVLFSLDSPWWPVLFCWTEKGYSERIFLSLWGRAVEFSRILHATRTVECIHCHQKIIVYEKKYWIILVTHQVHTSVLNMVKVV